MFLYRKNGKSAAHIWTGQDTACRMWSTGGMNQQKKYIKAISAGDKSLCTMCKNVAGESSPSAQKLT